MYWGSGSALGLLTCLGYVVFAFGAFLLWRNRAEFTLWIDDRLYAFRSSLSRYVPAGPFYERRRESRLVVIPVGFFHSIFQLRRLQCFWGACLLMLGLLLFTLDFFV